MATAALAVSATDPKMQDTLAARIRERQAFIEAVYRYVCTVLHEHGTVLKEDVHDNYICMTRELTSHAGFSLWSDGPHTMFGGEEFKVSLEGKLVLHVRYHRIEECTVVYFDPAPEWQVALAALAGAHAAKAAEAEAERKARAEVERRQREEAEARESAQREHAAFIRNIGKHSKRLLLD